MVFEGLVIFNVLTDTALSALKDKIDISVYFKEDAPEDEILSLRKSLESLAEVKKVDYISRDRALEIFKSQHADDPKISETISKALEELGENPLAASLNIKAYNPEDYVVIDSKLKNEASKDFIEKISYAQNEVVINRLNKIINTIRQSGLFLTVIFSVVSILITFNTIRLAIYSNREEIGIMRLVGGSNVFIRGPYVIEGLIYGLIAGVLSFLLVMPIVYFISPYLKIFIPEMNLWNYFTTNTFSLIGRQLMLGIGLGIISSYIAVRKYLKI